MKNKYINTCWNKDCMQHGCRSRLKRCELCGWKIKRLRDYDNEVKTPKTKELMRR